LLDQLELTLAELEASATADELAAEMAAAKTTRVASFTRKRPSRKPFPEHLPRERLIVPGPTACACCGGSRLFKLMEVFPKSWKVIQHVREKFICRDCEKISQAPAPFHVIAPRLGRTEPVGDGPVREVWPAFAGARSGRQNDLINTRR
jgi:transposase